MKPRVILLANDDDAVHNTLASVAHRRGCCLVEAAHPGAVLAIIRRDRADLAVISATDQSDWNELEVVRQLRVANARLPLILITTRSSEELAIAALKAGVNDYLKAPATAPELCASLGRLLEREPPQAVGGVPLPGAAGADWMIAGDPAMRRLRAYIGKAAATDSNVLITGETGTGEELVACLIHRASRRRSHAFVSINCAAIPETLLESELFGYERGAFTGAAARHEGKLKLADHGTVFFDEIGDMSTFAQSKILRAIESREVHRLGGHTGVPLDIRVIAATNQDLESLIKQQRFRSDLYFRLNVARIHLPPLRERKDDIPLLLEHYAGEFNRLFGGTVQGLTSETLERLLNYDWPGNVRELKNLLEAAFVNITSSPLITLDDLPDQFRRQLDGESAPRDERERALLALVATNWNKSKAAEMLHWSRMTLYRKMAKYHLLRSDDPSVSEAAADLPVD